MYLVNKVTIFLENLSKLLIFAFRLRGGIAQLARVLAWHARGHGFESHYLHIKPVSVRLVLLFNTTIISNINKIR